jgi:hypothetical protein
VETHLDIPSGEPCFIGHLKRRKYKAQLHATAPGTEPSFRMKRLQSALLLASIVCSYSTSTAIPRNCSDYTTCSDCVTPPRVTQGASDSCVWCNIDQKCHARQAMDSSPCAPIEHIESDNAHLCACKREPHAGVGIDACAWYNNTSGGSDFLPSAYVYAAACACRGEGDHHWTTPVSNCVRSEVLNGHKNLPDEIKQAREIEAELQPALLWLHNDCILIHVHAENEGCPKNTLSGCGTGIVSAACRCL